jgi:diguanylate cyclase (GGDEF)-like protein
MIAMISQNKPSMAIGVGSLLRMRIVVVDPSRTVLKIVTRLLEAGNHEVRPFTDGPEALAHIKADLEVDALITSAELPSMSGMDLCHATRKLPASRRPVYVVLMSSNFDQSKLIEALDNGADDFIGKPPATEELYARLRAAARLASMQRELVRMATTDYLSGALNRRAFFERGYEMATEAAAGKKLSAIIFDLDHFKRVNDTYGHDIGDEVIRFVSRAALAETDTLGRLGGEEFAILLRDCDLNRAAALAEKLRGRFSSLQINAAGNPVTFTCSFGVSEWEPGDSLDMMLKRADIALYKAKTTGRNRVVKCDSSIAVEEESHSTGIVRFATR